MGGVANFYMGNVLAAIALPVFSIGLGVDAWKIGLALGVPRIWDAITDPIMGHLSDSWRGRWGRRRPFVLAGALGVLATYSLLWLPTAAWDKDTIFWWFLVVSMLYYTAFTVFSIPFTALGYEIAPTSALRAKLMTVRSLFSGISSLLLPWAYAMCFWNWPALLKDGAPWGERIGELVVKAEGGVLPAGGYQIVGVGLALFMTVCALCVLLCRETPGVAAPSLKDFGRSARAVFENRAFRPLCGALFMILVGIFLVMPMATYVNIYHVFGGDQAAAALMLAKVGSVQTAINIASVPVVGWLVARKGAARMLGWFFAFNIAGFAIKYWTYTPEQPWLQIIPLAIWAFAWTGAMLAFNVLLGDICDYDEYHSGLRREGIYGAVSQMINKLGVGVATIISGGLLSLSGIVAGSSEQAPEAVWLIRVEFAFIPALALVVGLLVYRRYPLTDGRANEMRAEIAARKTAAASSLSSS
jgi:GPH family glycoside/pentoside/hexuronide:cation symporter